MDTTREALDTTLDARGLACPLPAVKARGALAHIPAGAALVVLATDPEAPIDVAAVALDAGCSFEAERDGAGWRLTLRRPTCAPGTRSGRRATGPASAP